MAPPTVDDYRPNGKYYQSVVVCFEGNESCPPIYIPYPPSEDFAKLGKKYPFFKAYLEEQVRRNKDWKRTVDKRVNSHERVEVTWTHRCYLYSSVSYTRYSRYKLVGKVDEFKRPRGCRTCAEKSIAKLFNFIADLTRGEPKWGANDQSSAQKILLRNPVDGRG